MKYEGNERLEKAYDFDNLQSLCQECHNAEHNHIKKYSDEEDLKTWNEKIPEADNGNASEGGYWG